MWKEKSRVEEAGSQGGMLDGDGGERKEALQL